MNSTDEARIVIPEDARADLNESGGVAMPMVIEYTDAAGVPHASPRGSTHVFDESRLCAWIRNPSGGLVAALAANDRVTVIYRNRLKSVYLKMDGRARVVTDPAESELIYSGSPFLEQMQDGARNGVGVIIELVRMAGYCAEGEPVLIGPA